MTNLNRLPATDYYDLAVKHFEEESFELASEELTKAIRLNPSEYSFYMLRARCFVNNDSYDLALADCNEAIALKQNSETYFNRGNVYFFSKQYKLALKDYYKSTELDKDSDAYFNRAISHLILGQPELALSDYEEMFIEKSPDSFQNNEEIKKSLFFAINLAVNIKSFDKGIEFIDLAFEHTPKEENIHKKIYIENIENAKELELRNNKLEKKQEQNILLQSKMQKLVEQFTHTLGNVIFPDTIYQVAERLKTNPDCRKDVLLLNEAYHSEIIIKLQAELLRRRHTNDNPRGFRDLIRSCRRKVESGDKTKSITVILDYAASRVTARFLNQHNASLGSIRDKILAQKIVSLEVLRQQFEDDILLNKTLDSVEWINQYLRPFAVVELSPLWQKVCILAESHAEALLFGYFSEVLFNAFKYADHDAEKFLTVRFDETVIESKTYLSCCWSNPMGNKTPNSLGTGKGLDAILEDLQQLNETDSANNSLLVTQNDEQFQVTMFFQKDLLIDEISMPTFKRKTKTE